MIELVSGRLQLLMVVVWNTNLGVGNLVMLAKKQLSSAEKRKKKMKSSRSIYSITKGLC